MHCRKHKAELVRSPTERNTGETITTLGTGQVLKQMMPQGLQPLPKSLKTQTVQSMY